MEMMLEGFNDRYQDEVVSRWGERAYQESNAWWHGKTVRQKISWKRETDELIAAWIAAREDGVSPTSQRAQALAAQHVEWLRSVPGTPIAEGDWERSVMFVRGLGNMYVEDPSFAATYGGKTSAAFVRDSLYEYTHLSM